jgi:signal transduction histidine kinase
MEGHAAACNVTVAADLPTALPTRRDPVALQLVLRNLLDNAIKYSSADGRVDVRARRDGTTAVVEVVDQGRGMDASELANAFLPFWRGSDAANGGTGLGLHLVRELLRKQDSTVTAASAGRDRGTTLTVRLPLSKEPA